jgi:hypothetical protein
VSGYAIGKFIAIVAMEGEVMFEMLSHGSHCRAQSSFIVAR